MEGKSKDLKEKEKDLIDTNNRLKKKEEDIESFKKNVDNLITENKKLNLEK
jgi:regulator of replication initiation timing